MVRHSEIPAVKVLFVFALALALCFNGLKLDFALWAGINFLIIVLLYFLKKTFTLAYGIALYGALFLCFSHIINSKLRFLENAPMEIAKPAFVISKPDGESDKFKRYYAQSFTNYKFRVYLDKELPILNIGDTLFTVQSAYKVENSVLPGKFNYKHYLLSKKITHQVFIKKASDYTLKQGGKSVPKKIHTLRNTIISNIHRDFSDPMSKGLVTAILTGDKSSLDENILKEFNSLGISHFLAVSGLHVGIIFLLLKTFLGFSNKKRTALKIVKTAIILLVLWFYAAITQFSPSVTRATFMFSLLLLGASLKRRSNPLNFWAVACLCILIFNPHQILDLGFQLSFGAVASILIFFRPIQSWFLSRWMILNKAWDILVVSTTAQLGTFPMIMYHFGQFPVYFLIANLWLSIFTFILVGLCFIYLLCSFSIPLSSLLSELITITCKGLHFGIEWFSRWPHKLFYIDLSFNSFLLLLLVMGLLGVFIVSRKKGALITSVFIGFGFVVNRIAESRFEPYLIHAKNEKVEKTVLVTPTRLFVFQTPYKENFHETFEWQNFLTLHQNKSIYIPQLNKTHKNQRLRVDLTPPTSQGNKCNTYIFSPQSSIPTTINK